MRPYVPAGPTRFAHQTAGLRKLIETRGVCALLYDPGTGKTATTLDYLSVLALAGGGREIRALVVAPLAAVDTWVRQAAVYVHGDVDVWAEVLGGSIAERSAAMKSRRDCTREPVGLKRSPLAYVRTIARDDWHRSSTRRKPGPMFSPGRSGRPSLRLLVINTDAFSSRHAVSKSRNNADVLIDAVKAFAPEVLIVDESHRIKSASGNASRALSRLTPYVPRRILLTGTVMPHSPLDVYGQWRFLAPLVFGYTGPDGERKAASFGRFRERFAVTGGYMGREIVGYQNLDLMHAAMRANSIVAKKEDVLDLPPVTDVTVDVELSSRESSAYAEMKDELAVELADGGFASADGILAKLMRLRQITSGHLPYKDDDHVDQLLELGDAKLATIRSIVSDTLAGEKRVVVFAHFVHEIEQLRTSLATRGTTVEVISGATSSSERLRIRERFGSDDPARIVLVAQTRTMSLAVNELVTASHAVFASLTQLRDDYEQARARLDRQGQTRPVTFWHAIAPGTIDEVILASHRTRTDVETSVLRHIMGRDEEAA